MKRVGRGWSHIRSRGNTFHKNTILMNIITKSSKNMNVQKRVMMKTWLQSKKWQYISLSMEAIKNVQNRSALKERELAPVEPLLFCWHDKSRLYNLWGLLFVIVCLFFFYWSRAYLLLFLCTLCELPSLLWRKPMLYSICTAFYFVLPVILLLPRVLSCKR